MDKIKIEYNCPFLTCLEVGPHQHPICPDCGAIRFGNISCKTCKEYQDIVNEDL